MKRTIVILVVLIVAPICFAGSPPVNLLVTPRIAMAIVSKDDRKLNDLDKAYLDAFTILREDNACSRLYGGPVAIEALNELMRVVRPSYLDRSIAVRMSGQTTLYRNAVTGFSFRMFEKAEINREGSFYRGNMPSQQRVPQVANYQPNTRQTRVALLLHELGHLVRGADNNWLLLDDGHDLDLSQRNTKYIVDVCRNEIAAVTRMSVAEQLEEPLTTIAQIATLP